MTLGLWKFEKWWSNAHFVSFLFYYYCNVAVECNLGHLQDFQKVGLFSDPAENRKVHKHFKIRRQFHTG